MILTDDDDDDCLNVTDARTTCEVITNENRADYFIQTKPIICTFFKPKNLTDNTKQNGGIFEKIKQSICCDIDNEHHDYKFPKIQTDSRQLSSTNSNLMKLDTVKQESLVKCERDLHSSFSTESSSLSNLPTISATYSKSTKSLSDSDNQDQLDNPTNSLIVKEVYSLCKKTIRSISTRKCNDANKSLPLNTSNKSCDNSIITVKKSVPAIKKLTKPSPKKPCNKSKTRSSTKINSKTTEETLQRIVDVFKLAKQNKKTKTNNTNSTDINDNQSESSDALTEAMREDINDFDLEPVKNDQSKYSLMQPIILLEPLQIDKVSRLKRKISNNSCVNSWEPLEKKLKLNCSFVSNDSTKIITNDKFNLRKKDDASITTEKTSLSCDSLFNERNNSHNRVIYHSMRDIVENDTIYCFMCKKSNKSPCKIHPVSWIANENVYCPYAEYFISETFEKYFHNHSEKQLCSCNQNELDHIQINLPNIFHLKESANSEIGIWTKQKVKQGSIIGPYLGEIVENWKYKKSVSCPYKTRRLLKSENYDELHCLEFAFKSNWLRCINFTNEDALANLKVLKYDGKIFFQSTKEIPANRELLVSDKGDFDILKLKKKPICKLNCSDSVNVKNRSISEETVCSSLDKPLNSDHKKNAPPEHQKINKSIIIEKEKVLKSESQNKVLKNDSQNNVTVSETLPICETKHRKKKEITVNKKFSKYLSRLKLRHRESFLSKIDREIIDYVSELMIVAPLLTSSEINKKFRKIFPSKPEISNLFIKQIICLLDLRPLQGKIDNDDVDREIVEEIVEMFTFNKGLKLEEAEKHLSIEFPSMKRKLSVETIDKIVKLNRCRISEEQDIFRVDQDVLKEVRTSITAGEKSKRVISEKIRQKFSEKEIVTIQYIGFLVKKYNLLKRKSDSVVLKFDEEMKSTIYKLHQDHPEYSAPKINELLRNLLPDKPVVSRHTIAKRIRQFRLANRC